ncbi:Crp/Fnr family transcriptional regulator [Tsuneonella sp. HG222]
MSLACAECPVRDRAACSVLDDAGREALARSGRTRTFRRGETVFAAGEPSTNCATLVSGALKISATDEDGSERILALVHPAGFVGELFAPFAAHDITALTDSKVCLFAQADLDRAVQDHPALARALLRRTQEDLHESRRMLELTSRRSAEERVGNLLLALARAASDSPCHPAGTFELPLTRGEMASLLGLTIETVSRMLSALEADGAIRKRGARGIELLDPARLGAAAD